MCKILKPKRNETFLAGFFFVAVVWRCGKTKSYKNSFFGGFVRYFTWNGVMFYQGIIQIVFIRCLASRCAFTRCTIIGRTASLDLIETLWWLMRSRVYYTTVQLCFPYNSHQMRVDLSILPALSALCLAFTPNIENQYECWRSMRRKTFPK